MRYDLWIGSALSFATTLALAAPASAQIASSAADNDLDPSFDADGWHVTAGAYQVVTAPRPADGVRGGYGMHDWLYPPDGNAYAGGSQYGGEPGTQSVLEKTITGLSAGREYAVEADIMSDNIDGEDQTTDVYFDVTFCGSAQESYHIPFLRKRSWIQQSLRFVATSDSCTLSFRARGAAAAMDSAPSGWRPGTVGNGLNYIFLDSVQVAVASESDLGLVVTGPASFAPSGSTETLALTVSNRGPEDGTAPVVTYRLPRGVSAHGPDPLAVTGPDAASWSCRSVPVLGRSEPIAAREDRGRDSPSQATIACTRASAIAAGADSAFAFEVDFAAASEGTAITSRLAVHPSFPTGNVDPEAGNDGVVVTSVASESAVIPADAGVAADAGNPACDGNSELDPERGVCVTRPPPMLCSVHPGLPGSMAPMLLLSMIGVLLSTRRLR